MSFFDELAKHADSAYGAIALLCTLVIIAILKYARTSLKVAFAIIILVMGIGAVLGINYNNKPTTQIFNQSNNGSGGVFNINSGSGVQINNEEK